MGCYIFPTSCVKLISFLADDEYGLCLIKSLLIIVYLYLIVGWDAPVKI